MDIPTATGRLTFHANVITPYTFRSLLEDRGLPWRRYAITPPCKHATIQWDIAITGSKLLGLAASFALSATPAVAADQPADSATSTVVPTDPDVTQEELNLAREILAHAFPPDQRLQMTLNTSRSMAEQTMLASMQSVTDPEIRQIAKTFLDEIMRDMEPAINRFIPHQFEAMEQAYAREFTLEELTQVNQFAQTQAGQRYLQRSQTLLNDPDVVAANQAFFEDAQRIRAARMPILIERMRAYREQHTDSVTKP